MGTFKIKATIYVDSHRVNSKGDVSAELQDALDCYYYGNKSDAADIAIQHDSVKKIKREEFMKEVYGL